MNESIAITLKKDGEQADIPDKQLAVTLSWATSVNLDLMVFYRAKDGRMGGIFSSRYEGGSTGILEEFPFIRLSDDAGIETDTEKKEKSLRIVQLNDMKEIFFCAVNFADSQIGANTAFGLFDLQLIISDGSSKPVLVPLDSIGMGTVAFIARIDNTGFLGPKLVRENRIMDIQTFQQTILGADVLTLFSKKESLGKAEKQDKNAGNIISELPDTEKSPENISEHADQDIKSDDSPGEDTSPEPYDPEKEKLFMTGLLAMMFLFIKDKGLNNDLRMLEKIWKKGILKKEILKRVKNHPVFMDMLDKTEIFQFCYETVIAAYQNDKLSESVFISGMKKFLKDFSEDDRKHLVDMILIMAFADNVITEREKEAMGQLIRHLGIREALFNEMFEERAALVAREVRDKKKRRSVKMIIAVCCLLLVTAGTMFILKKKNQSETAAFRIHLKLVSNKVPRKNNIYPLRRQFPFKAELTFDVTGIAEEKRKELCDLLMIPSDNFEMKKCSVVQYEGNRLVIEAEAESKNAGEKILSFALKENSVFELEGDGKTPTIFQDRIEDCTQYLESRYDSSKEFESGKEFAECVDRWMITSELQENQTELLESERVIPQHDFDLFLSNFIHAENRPNNPFNWFLGVLSVKPKKDYEPYLAIFQKACLSYLKKISNGDNPLVAYFAGMNPDVNDQYNRLDKSPNCLITGSGIEEIGETDFLRKKKMFTEIQAKGKYFEYEGDRTENDGNYILKKDESRSPKIPVWIFNDENFHEKIGSPYEYEYHITDTNLINTEFCVRLESYFPKHSLGVEMEMSDGDNCKQFGESGYNFDTLFKNRKEEADEDMQSMARFAHSQIMAGYSYTSYPYTNLNGIVYLLGLATYTNNHLVLYYLTRTEMEKGQINISIKASELPFLSIGGFLIYAYDITNKKFGVILDLSQPEFEGAYIEAHGNFYPLD